MCEGFEERTPKSWISYREQVQNQSSLLGTPEWVLELMGSSMESLGKGKSLAGAVLSSEEGRLACYQRGQHDEEASKQLAWRRHALCSENWQAVHNLLGSVSPTYKKVQISKCHLAHQMKESPGNWEQRLYLKVGKNKWYPDWLLVQPKLKTMLTVFLFGFVFLNAFTVH